jgi:hypothetical protein
VEEVCFPGLSQKRNCGGIGKGVVGDKVRMEVGRIRDEAIVSEGGLRIFINGGHFWH